MAESYIFMRLIAPSFVVMGVWQRGPPNEKDFLEVAGRKQEVEEAFGLGRRTGEKVFRAQEHGTVFDEKRNGNHRLEPLVRQPPKQLVGSTLS